MSSQPLKQAPGTQERRALRSRAYSDRAEAVAGRSSIAVTTRKPARAAAPVPHEHGSGDKVAISKAGRHLIKVSGHRRRSSSRHSSRSRRRGRKPSTSDVAAAASSLGRSSGDVASQGMLEQPAGGSLGRANNVKLVQARTNARATQWMPFQSRRDSPQHSRSLARAEGAGAAAEARQQRDQAAQSASIAGTTPQPATTGGRTRSGRRSKIPSFGLTRAEGDVAGEAGSAAGGRKISSSLGVPPSAGTRGKKSPQPPPPRLARPRGNSTNSLRDELSKDSEFQMVFDRSAAANRKTSTGLDVARNLIDASKDKSLRKQLKYFDTRLLDPENGGLVVYPGSAHFGRVILGNYYALQFSVAMRRGPNACSYVDIVQMHDNAIYISRAGLAAESGQPGHSVMLDCVLHARKPGLLDDNILLVSDHQFWVVPVSAMVEDPAASSDAPAARLHVTRSSNTMASNMRFLGKQPPARAKNVEHQDVLRIHFAAFSKEEGEAEDRALEEELRRMVDDDISMAMITLQERAENMRRGSAGSATFDANSLSWKADHAPGDETDDEPDVFEVMEAEERAAAEALIGTSSVDPFAVTVRSDAPTRSTNRPSSQSKLPGDAAAASAGAAGAGASSKPRRSGSKSKKKSSKEMLGPRPVRAGKPRDRISSSNSLNRAIREAERYPGMDEKGASPNSSEATASGVLPVMFVLSPELRKYFHAAARRRDGDVWGVGEMTIGQHGKDGARALRQHLAS